jgi:hypothetical protein
VLSRKLILSFIAVFVLSSFSFVVLVEADSIFWAHSYETEFDSSSGICVVATSDGGYAVAGSLNSHASLFKTDAYGNMEWNKTYQGIWSDRFRSLVVASDGGYAIAGSTNLDFWLVKTDEHGNVEWNKTYGGTHGDTAHSLVATSDGGYAIAGTLTSEDVVQFDAWLVKVDAYGNMEWNKTYGKFGVEDYDFFYSVIETSDGGFALAGSTYFMGLADGKWIEEDKNFWLVKTDAFGNMIWEKTYGGARDDVVCSVVEASDGGYALAGSKNGDFWLVKTDQYGNVEWDKLYGEFAEGETAHSMIRTSDGGYAIAGTQPYHPDPTALYRYSNFWLVKTDASGNMEWNTSIGGSAADVPESLAEANDGGYVMVGSMSDRHSLISYILLVKTDETGYFEGTIIPEYHSLPLPSMLLAATLVIVIYKKKFFDDHP